MFRSKTMFWWRFPFDARDLQSYLHAHTPHRPLSAESDPNSNTTAHNVNELGGELTWIRPIGFFSITASCPPSQQNLMRSSVQHLPLERSLTIPTVRPRWRVVKKLSLRKTHTRSKNTDCVKQAASWKCFKNFWWSLNSAPRLSEQNTQQKTL